MKRPIVDHLWTKIADDDYIGTEAVNQKLEEVVRLARTIGQAEGSDVADNVLDSGLIETALLRCKQYRMTGSNLTIDDLQINYRYATSAMQKAEKVIDDELSHLDL